MATAEEDDNPVELQQSKNQFSPKSSCFPTKAEIAFTDNSSRRGEDVSSSSSSSSSASLSPQKPGYEENIKTTLHTLVYDCCVRGDADALHECFRWCRRNESLLADTFIPNAVRSTNALHIAILYGHAACVTQIVQTFLRLPQTAEIKEAICAAVNAFASVSTAHTTSSAESEQKKAPATTTCDH